MMKHMSSDQQLTALTAVPPNERTPEEQARILELSQQRIAEKTASAPGVAPTILGQDTPQQTGQKTAAEIHGGTPKAAVSNSDIARMAKEQGLPYDESKFKYRIGPNGQVQSAPK
jgi:predicted transposase YdaD